MFGPDGSFRIEDVPAGEYLLKLSLIRPWTPADGNQPNFNSIAALEKPVVVRADSDLDLGLLELQPVNSP